MADFVINETQEKILFELHAIVHVTNELQKRITTISELVTKLEVKNEHTPFSSWNELVQLSRREDGKGQSSSD